MAARLEVLLALKEKNIKFDWNYESGLYHALIMRSQDYFFQCSMGGGSLSDWAQSFQKKNHLGFLTLEMCVLRCYS